MVQSAHRKPKCDRGCRSAGYRSKHVQGAQSAIEIADSRVVVWLKPKCDRDRWYGSISAQEAKVRYGGADSRGGVR